MSPPTIDQPIEISAGVFIPASEITFRTSRSGGPGGQHVNTTDTRVEALLNLRDCQGPPDWLRARMLSRLAGRLSAEGELRVVAHSSRSQLANKLATLDKLAAILKDAAAPPPKKRVKTRPTLASKERRVAGKKLRGEVKRGRSSGSSGSKDGWD